ncbi:MAG: sodium-dependent transporter [Nitrosopumilaceae archaeon]|nr:sodium-dependent transporter [Nitrosopumilaceae archaeon]NIU00907.1 sodium-dependent transporter [Nitrosopumilaceae archaeon]NIU87360.1 sodium-dependent transporter [Nitrosopumilaceae archaeon]NIV65888.1 sodium-dependent transporter [Nitrosopumilaceae archaeon]NIX61509.1 sodium-dependent transporter [Nitrosopumilaceae archaeon]
MQKRESWNSHVGFILSSVGSAVGLGNIWRFPYVVGENGGGAFLVPYVIIIVGFGLIFMIIEFAVGRYHQTSILSCLIKTSKKFKMPGLFIVSVSFVILSYYLVVLGWILSYTIFILTGSFQDFESFTNSWLPVFSFVIVLGFSYGIVRRGITRGIEKLNKIGIILLISLLIPLAIYGMSLPEADGGLKYYLTPDFSKLYEPSIWSTAFGQVFFSLSLGLGILVTYGSYLKEKKSLVTSSSIIVATNSMVSFVGGLMIFSIVFSFGMDPSAGPSLVFQVMPSIFSIMEFGTIIGVTFFLLLLIAGLTSAVSLFQVSVSTLEDHAGYSKSKSSSIIAVLLLIAGIFSALSYSSANLQLFGSPILDLLDTYFGTYGLAISGIVFIVIITWFMDRRKILEQINLNSRIKIPDSAFSIIKFTFPALVILSILFTIIVEN